MISGHLQGPFPPEGDIQTKTTGVKKSKKSRSPSWDSPLPFPQLDISAPRNLFTTKKAPVRDSLLRELDELLHMQADQIETAIEELENEEQRKELIDAALEMENWGSGILSFTNNQVHGGVEFLAKVLPSDILNHLPHKELENLGGLTALGSTLLSALDSGSQGLALICKSKILAQSKEMLQQFKASFKNNQFEPQDIDSIKTAEDQAIGEAKREKFQNKIMEWELQIKLEEEALAEEITQFQVSAASNILTLLSVPVIYLPKELVFEHLHLAAGGIMWITSGLEIIAMGIELKQTREETVELHHWIQAYKEWQDHYQPKFTITESGAQRDQFIPVPTPPPLSNEEHENSFIYFIETTQHFDYIKKKLHTFGIILDSSITSKEELLAYFQTNPQYRQQLTEKYIEFQRQLEALNAIIHKSGNLLAKRQAIRDKKVLLLKPRFESVKTKIKDLKRSLFIKDMQQLLLQLKSSQCTSQEIEERLKQWQIFDPSMNVQNSQLLTALENFKTAEKGNRDGTSSAMPQEKKNLIHALNGWLNHPNTREKQFNVWFSVQPEKSLLEAYVDHQETLELTTKTALKQMVAQKHTLESRLQDFKSTKSHIHFSTALIALTVTLTLTIVGLLTAPLAGAGLILLALSIGTTTVSLGLLGAGYFHYRYYKPHTAHTMSFLFQIKMAWTKLRASISTYSHQAKEKKYLEVAKILRKLHPMKAESKQASEYQKALAEYKKAKLDFEESQTKVHHWTEKLKQFETKLAKEGWKDFAQYASLQIADRSADFDTLQAFQEALQACDLRLLSAETKTLLELQLGVNLEILQAQIDQDPQTIKNTLQEFFTLEDVELIDFIRNQKARIKKGLLKPHAA